MDDFCGAEKGKTTRRGCVGLCKSKDLHHWDYCEPFYAPMNAQCAFECPDFFRMGDWYYLVFFFVCGPLSDDVPEEQKSVWTVADAGN